MFCRFHSSFQICSDTAAEIIQLHNSGKPVSKQSNGLVDASTAYRFLNQMKKRFSAVLKRLRTFNDLFTCSAVKIGPCLMISPGFLHFRFSTYNVTRHFLLL
ncbi:hypothetical protein [Allobaculum mucilyticum]|uniref:hypothetical protein n=1 Tax=Allobaculum mucilyticum TaxID=2834459 RepID=UPI001F609EB1|nr:hypothetical protein [Allobaculum mucilyticum]UNT95024.1 hypothetical protein KWG62_06500 [Allobaculum mucilyticum]